MTWKLRPDITPTLNTLVEYPAQAVYELDTGALVALSIAATPTAAATLACTAACWLVDEDGDMQAVAHHPVLVSFSHTADLAQVTSLGMQTIVGALRDLLLGELPEDPPVIPWSDQVRTEASIRNLIAITTALGTPIDWSAE